jgi:hypothetical protein
MKASTLDQETFQTISPQSLAGYLAAQNWQPVRTQPGRFTIWQHAGKGATVLVPETQDLVDYALRVSEAVALLEERENRPRTSIIKDLQRAFADVVRIRIEAEGLTKEEIRLDAGVALIENARNLVLAAACTAVNRQPFYPPRKPEPAVKYLQHIFLGQTEPGSYVLPIISPLFTNAPIEGLSLPEPFERRVTRTLIESVGSAVRIAIKSEREKSIDGLLDIIRSGDVSTNLCDALVGLTEGTAAARIGITIRWAPGSGLGNPAVPNHLTVPQKVAPALKDASQRIKDQLAFDDFPVEGYITDLHGDLQLQDGTSKPSGGTIAVAAQVEGQVKKINVRLGFEDYEKAARAHTSGVPISLKGNLRKDGRFYILKDPKNIVFEFPEAT